MELRSDHYVIRLLGHHDTTRRLKILTCPDTHSNIFPQQTSVIQHYTIIDRYVVVF